MFTNQNVTAKARKRIVDIVRESHSEDIHRTYEDRFRHFVLTEVAPNHWPNDLKVEFSISSQPGDKDHYETSVGDYGSKEFMLDGENILGDDIAPKCKESFSAFLTILEKLKIQNEHFFDFDLTNDMLRYHIAETRSVDDLALIKDYAASQERWLNSEITGCLAKRFLEFGDQDRALEWFGMAYANRFDWFHWKSSADYLAAIAEKDKSMAKNRLLERCYDSASGPERGFNTAPIAAAGYDVLDEPDMIEAVFNNFLRHCESLFAQLPRDDDYAWLKGYVEPDSDVDQRILQFSIEELGTQEIDLGERMVRALTRLAITRPDSAIPPLIRRALEASGRILRRLLMILHTLASQRPELLVSHQQLLATLLDHEDFLCCQTATHILRCLNEVSPLESSVAKAAQRIERKYSAAMSTSTYRLPSGPSPSFSTFFTDNTRYDFQIKVSLLEEFLQIPPGSLIAAIEENLMAQNWSLQEERSRVKSDWNGRVHPQGWPVIGITTEFQELATEAVWSILNDSAEKMKLSPGQVRSLWQTIQVVDPEYVVRGVMSRPLDIEIFHVTDKDGWFKELDAAKILQFENSATDGQAGGWVTVFEMRRRAFEGQRHSLFGQEMLLQGTLIPLQFYGGAHALDELALVRQPILPDGELSVTMAQARDALLKTKATWSAVNDSIPLVAVHHNPMSFVGYEWVCTLSSFIMDEFKLSFSGFDLTKEGEVVAKYETWEEGYLNEKYTREKLSSGVRLRVRRDFLANVCLRYQKILCVHTEENRFYHVYNSNRIPDDERNSKRYILCYL